MKFPVDPNAPVIIRGEGRPTTRSLWKRIEQVVLVASIIISIVGIYIAIRSLQISEISYKASVQQFVENSKSSEIQFDTVTNILSNYEKVSKDILAISRSQLDGSNDLINQIAVLTTPKLYIDNASIEKRLNGSRNTFNTFLSILINTVGRETIVLLSAEALFVNSDRIMGAQKIANLNQQMRNEYVMTFRTKYVSNANEVIVVYLKYKDLYMNKIITKAFYLKAPVQENTEQEYSDFSVDGLDNGYYLVLSSNCTAIEIINANRAIDDFKRQYPTYKFYPLN